MDKWVFIFIGALIAICVPWAFDVVSIGIMGIVIAIGGVILIAALAWPFWEAVLYIRNEYRAFRSRKAIINFLK
ncbi:TPA: hypothetical protein N3D36_004584 [Salmonella enterica subsp. enterica serovar Lehrte]|nr:hypothetical protein [Salmonella enterica subsp. enterica serovar Aba]EBU7764566.1 hypothetical protein [Salmonella enterica subsp. enterica serovar Rovaniemi]ECK4582595.1 hypothetical protein [Salmonella enterica]ECQ1750119.1 hypothetical protein [Salmonella enterica subsp. enterica serovar Malstatt]EGF4598778.1 hypothetical protein [Salmonella enterica subsp. enterica serovar Agama]EHK8090904.1 hypothetical protein [Salmonella enterica subsp. enterica serovar Nigeria]HCM2495371.1 hypothe